MCTVSTLTSQGAIPAAGGLEGKLSLIVVVVPVVAVPSPHRSTGR